MKGQPINFYTPKHKLRSKIGHQDNSLCSRNIKALSYNDKFDITPQNTDPNKLNKRNKNLYSSRKQEDWGQLIKRLKEAQTKINKQKQTIKIMEETIHELDKLNQELVQQSKMSAQQLQQFTVKANAEINEKNQLIENLQKELRKFQWKIKNMSNISSQRSNIILKESMRNNSNIQQQLKRKNSLIQQLEKKLSRAQRQKSEKITQYEKIIDEKESLIIKMSEFNNELCMKLMLNRSKSNQIQCIEDQQKRQNQKNMKKKVFEIMQEKEQMSRKLQQHSEKIAELQAHNQQLTKLIRPITMKGTKSKVHFTKDQYLQNLSSAEGSQFQIQNKISQINSKGYSNRYDESHITIPQSARSKKMQFTFAEEKNSKNGDTNYDLFGQNSNRKLFELTQSAASNCLKDRIQNQLLDLCDSLN